MPQFDISTFPSQLLWLAIFFLGQYLIMSKFIGPKFFKVFETRKKYIASQIEKAASLTTEAKILKGKYEIKLLEMQKENLELISDALAQIKAAHEEENSQLEAQFAKERKDHEKKMNDFYDSFADNLSDVSLEAARAIIAKVANMDAKKKELSKYIN